MNNRGRGGEERAGEIKHWRKRDREKVENWDLEKFWNLILPRILEKFGKKRKGERSERGNAILEKA